MKPCLMTFADKIIEFNQTLGFAGKMPTGINLLNPFKGNQAILAISSAFYAKYYGDKHPRHMILGINPGRFGGGVTGIPFTDTKRLTNECGIPYHGSVTHEPSSVFVYEVIEAYGGIDKFYNNFYINSVCPLGFTISDEKGKEKNYNYYDSLELTDTMYPFIVGCIQKQIDFGIKTDVCFCFGTGRNEKFLRTLNNEKGFFNRIIALEHPRFVMQYKAKSKQMYIDKYINAFSLVNKTPVL